MTRREILGASVSVVASGGALGGADEAAQPGQHAAPGAPSPAREVMEAEVAAGQMPGAVWLVARGDDVHVDAVGVTEVGGSAPMRRDTIFRIASMTKAVTAAAMMMLVEEGKLDLDSPVDPWLPELANRKVLARIDGPIDETVPAERPITVRDLMTFTMGFGVLFDASSPIQRAIDELQLANGQPVPMTPHGPDEWIRRLGTLPLMHQPGAQWMYNTGSLVQGVLVRRAAEQSFDAFVRERILAPLGMRDTDFHVPANKLDRLAGCGYFTDPQTGAKTRMDRDGAESAYASPPTFPSGAAGLVSTVDDYLLFARMLMNGGVHEGRRILSAASVRAMTADHLTPAQKAASSFFPGFFETHGWGYGLAVITAPDAVSEVPGRHGWDGGFGTSWINDPSRALIGIVMTQASNFLFSGALERFWRSVYVADRP
ncbi:serine hydrolase domain-containing protein [Sorangium sp. So ce406]|uniref:serine hydrolase domain-containing protein n=1 Tax=Sorangium sp. So ce406 TaxID=3133311 RepID=UPI003F5C6ED0